MLDANRICSGFPKIPSVACEKISYLEIWSDLPNSIDFTLAQKENKYIFNRTTHWCSVRVDDDNKTNFSTPNPNPGISFADNFEDEI